MPIHDSWISSERRLTNGTCDLSMHLGLLAPAQRASYAADHEPSCLPILLISPRSHACAASVLTRGCQIIRYLKPVISPGAFSTLIFRFSASSPANRRGAVRISLVPGMHRVAAPKYGRGIRGRRGG